MYIVEVIDIETKEVVKSLKTENERKADRIEIGLLYQTNLDKYFVSTREE